VFVCGRVPAPGNRTARETAGAWKSFSAAREKLFSVVTVTKSWRESGVPHPNSINSNNTHLQHYKFAKSCGGLENGSVTTQ
jgi:hypothetical protein